jgi:5'-phosphate synthase pdxT subunit
MKTVGVLALQGNFEAHRQAMSRTGARTIEVRTAAEMNRCDGLILPGGESTTMLKLLDVEELFEPLREFALKKPVFGTCAGAILLATEVSHPAQRSLALMDIAVERNGYGRQVDSRVAKVSFGIEELEAVFIRAPIIRHAGPKATVVAAYQGDPVWVEQGRHMVTTFHPELTKDSRVHARFLEKL